MTKRAPAAFVLIATLLFFGCEEDDTYEFHVENNGTETFYIECWEEITVEGNYIGPGESGEITLSGKARDGEYVQLCVENEFCTTYAITNYDTFYVEVTPDNNIDMSD